jgi:hypothetical protein
MMLLGSMWLELGLFVEFSIGILVAPRLQESCSLRGWLGWIWLFWAQNCKSLMNWVFYLLGL